MICTFCGTENPQGNRFCGMCGVRLERRKTERRTEQRESQPCSGCGHVNEPWNKFCGMCGVRVDRRMQERRGAGDASRATAKANAQLPSPEPAGYRQAQSVRTSSAVLLADRDRPQPVATPHSSQPETSSVAGPSFLGLNDTYAEGEYLLEDERAPRRGLRAFLLLIVLAAIVGLIFVQYRSSLKANPKSPETPNPGPATVPRPQGTNRPPTQDRGLQTAAAIHSLEAAVPGVVKAVNLRMNAATVPALKKNGDEQDDLPGNAAVAKDDPPARATDDKPSPALIRAQQYLHGSGVRQNCEQGLIYLRVAARENDPRAAVQMGALYLSGLCVTRDRVKAYEWFNSARELQPQNRWIEKNLNELWAQMTPQERRQIHR